MMYEWFIPVYDIGILCISPLFLMKYAFRKRIKRELLQRLFLSQQSRRVFDNLNQPIWIHAVSVGEVNSLKEFLNRLKERFPDTPVVISTITPQGKELAVKLFKDSAFIFYLPLDISFIVKRFIKSVSPRMFLVAETELWPNLYYYLRKRGVPIFIFNARISDKSFSSYKAARFFFKRILKNASFIACQDEKSRERFIRLGMRPDLVKAVGNIKFRSIEPDAEKLEHFKRIYQNILQEDELLIVAGSTHSPEEEFLLDAYKDIAVKEPRVRLLICPRHVQRIQEISNLVTKYGFKPVKTSTLSLNSHARDDQEVFIVDTIGELLYWYSVAAIAFVGGSLVKHGGQNILEPAYFSKPVVFGQHMFNFEDMRRNFLDNDACIQVNDRNQLTGALLDLIRDSNKRKTLGFRGRSIIDNSKDSVGENLSILDKYISKRTARPRWVRLRRKDSPPEAGPPSAETQTADYKKSGALSLKSESAGIRSYFIDLVEGKREGLAASVIKAFLSVLSCIYGLVILVRNFLYDRNVLLRQRGFKIPVISVGNLTWGGTGKTSMAIFLGRAFSSRKVAILTRGYGDDETVLLCESLKGSRADVYAGKNRRKILKEIAPEYDLAVLDDGFQYRSISRALDILLVNGANPFGRGKLIPLGILREPLRNVKRARVAVIMHSQNQNAYDLLTTVNPGIKIFYGRYEPGDFIDLLGEAHPKEEFLNKPVACFCAIGFPAGFINSLESINIKPKLKYIYPDHHLLKESQFRRIEQECLSLCIKDLIITAKDKSRFRFPTALSIYALDIVLRIDKESDFLSLTRNVLANKNSK